MIIPAYVWNMAYQIQVELERQILKMGENAEILRDDLKEIKEIRQDMIEQKGKYFQNEDDYINMLELMTAIMGTTYEMWAPALDRVYKEVIIEDDLCFALNHAKAIHPRMKKEIRIINEFLKNIHNQSFCQIDARADFRVLKFVKTERAWNSIMEEFDGHNIGANNFKYLKIGYVESETDLHSLKGNAKKAKDHLVEKIGEQQFYWNRSAFKKWFKIGKTGTYYIYVPK